MDSNKSSEPSGLRRSQRRNKFHLDVAAMLIGNNPDRRLSPQPHQQTDLDNQILVPSSKRSNVPRVTKKMKKLLAQQLTVSQSIKLPLSVEPVSNNVEIIKNVKVSISSATKTVSNVHNTNKLKVINISTSMTTKNSSKSPSLQIASELSESSITMNKFCNDTSTTDITFSTIPIVSNTSTTLSQSFFSLLTNNNKELYVATCDEQSSTKSITQFPICSTKIVTGINKEAITLHSQVIYYIL